VEHVPKECRDSQCAAHGVAVLHARAAFGRRPAIARSGSVMTEPRLDAANCNDINLLVGWDPTEPVATRPLWMQRVSGTYNFFYFHDGNKNTKED